MTRPYDYSQKPTEADQQAFIETVHFMRNDREERKHRQHAQAIHSTDSAMITEISPQDAAEMEDIAQEIQDRGGGEDRT